MSQTYTPVKTVRATVSNWSNCSPSPPVSCAVGTWRILPLGGEDLFPSGRNSLASKGERPVHWVDTTVALTSLLISGAAYFHTSMRPGKPKVTPFLRVEDIHYSAGSYTGPYPHTINVQVWLSVANVGATQTALGSLSFDFEVSGPIDIKARNGRLWPEYDPELGLISLAPYECKPGQLQSSFERLDCTGWPSLATLEARRSDIDSVQARLVIRYKWYTAKRIVAVERAYDFSRQLRFGLRGDYRKTDK